ncbi:uncharacterized protein HMPREF1541_02820 [Cyphellophora europaea CBS 101466]|uniref:Uncharacterized protein n=1 Tax=Cyphellophora europaea (strain CBS 101466) TaxID=1220924 RepID=W2S4N1_CYPE1|nr:uncharacterized protein HMPREF1541_02820 [Cyphellophora europaea CBS 101466]ETN43661.1 hypothetical protein HMPREF1541_02820 [Cyphellophora europaea CBS 101466]
MSNNRQSRRAEERRALHSHSQRIDARAATKRRNLRIDTKRDAQEINRMKVRKKFGIPDDPTTLEQVVESMHLAVRSLYCFGGKKGLKTVIALALTLVAFAAALYRAWLASAHVKTDVLKHLDLLNASLDKVTWATVSLGE